MAPEAQTNWKAPKGYTLGVVPGRYVNRKGSPTSANADDLMPDGQVEVAHFFEDEPFTYGPNDGKGPNASVEAREAALAGTPLEGWSPNAILLPIKDGWVPAKYTLTHDDDPSLGAVEPHDRSDAA